MTVKLLFSAFITSAILTKFGHSQICTKQSMEATTKQVSYTYTYTESYRTKCWYKENCIKTRTRMSRTFKTVPSRHMIIVQECCPGYIREDTDNDTISCRAICVPACIHGECSKPGECSCFEGYSPPPNNTHECQPVCDQECGHGSCIAPQTCSCNFGYSLLNGTCQPICSESCENGACTAPDTCECLPGYRETNGSCEPYCSRGCTHGVCIDPEKCQCDPGYSKEDNQCVPTCEQDCANGTCVGPNICLCNPGFEYRDDICEPVCNKSCGSGKCIGPDICECDPGYDVQNGTCQANCTGCANGDCIEPNICKCYPGYAAHSGYANNSDTCVPVCKNCEGKCVAPNNCVCELPLIAKNKTASDEDCDCNENCTGVAKKCEKTICFNPLISYVNPDKETILYNDEEMSDEESFDGNDENAEDYNELIQKYEGTTRSYADTVIIYSKQEYNNWFMCTGIYVIIAVAVLLSLIMLVSWFVMRKFFTGGSYVVEDNQTGFPASRSIDLESPSRQDDQSTI